MIKIDQNVMLAYLNDRLDDPVTQQWLDQLFAACDELRASVGVAPRDRSQVPSARNFAAANAMWKRLREESANNVCEHVMGRPLQPVVIVPEDSSRMCGECWNGYDWHPLPNDLPTREARKLSCDCCERRFTRRWDDFDTGDEGIWTETFQWWNFIAPLRLCVPCHRTLNYSTETLPPDVRSGVANAPQERA